MTAAATTRPPRRFPFVPARSTIVSLASGDGTPLCAANAGDSRTSATADISCFTMSPLAATGARSRQFLISVMDHRRPGSQLKQCFAMSSNGGGMFSGNSGSFSFVLSHVGRRFVSASTSVTPSDQISLLGDIAPLAFSGASYALPSPEDLSDSPIGRIPA